MHSKIRTCLLIGTLLATAACTSPAGETEPIPVDVEVRPVFEDLSFESITGIASAHGGSEQLFVMEQEGVIQVVSSGTGAAESRVFLDITGRTTRGSEEGLLGLAFHPDYESNGYFYVQYSALEPRRSVISRFEVSSQDPNTADPSSEQVLLEVEQPEGIHNGGQLAFGLDGYLYVGLGMGGPNGDPNGNAQDLGRLLGSILRIDVDRTQGDRAYAIPPDNPFVDDPDARDEIWAYGFRNPWRFSFDAETGRLYVGDVGQGETGIGQPGYGEINHVQAGANYGWNLTEGTHCYPPPDAECEQDGLVPPLVEHELYSEGDCAVIGGHVYRGDPYPELGGLYFYGDFCSGHIRAITHDSETTTHHGTVAETGLQITAFGEDAEGSLYVASYQGQLYELVAAD